MELSGSIYDLLVRPKILTKFMDAWYQNVLSGILPTRGTVLDFGCGTGTHCKLFSPEQYIGIDVAADRIKVAQQKNSAYKFESFDGVSIPIKDKSVSLIIIASVIHHIDPKTMLQLVPEFKRVLKDDGLLVLIEPCLTKEHRITNLIMKTLDRGEYIRNKEQYLSEFRNDFDPIEERQLRKLLYWEMVLVFKKS